MQYTSFASLFALWLRVRPMSGPHRLTFPACFETAAGYMIVSLLHRTQAPSADVAFLSATAFNTVGWARWMSLRNTPCLFEPLPLRGLCDAFAISQPPKSSCWRPRVMDWLCGCSLPPASMGLCTDPCRIPTFLLERAFLHFHVSWWQDWCSFRFRPLPGGHFSLDKDSLASAVASHFSSCTARWRAIRPSETVRSGLGSPLGFAK